MSDENTTEAVAPPAPEQPRVKFARKRTKRALLLRIVAAIVVLGVLGWAAWYYFDGRWYAETDDAYVNGNVVQITPKVPGTVVTIGADDGDLVHAGDVLVQLDPSDTEVALEAASANLASAVRTVRGLNSNVASAAAEMDARRTDLAKARADYERRRGLAKSGAISAELLAHARDTYAAARAALAAATQQHANADAQVSGTDVAGNPLVKAAEAKLRAAYLDHVHTTMIAPVDGFVAQRTVQLGEHVAPGRALMAVVPLASIWVDANFKETQLKHMRIGQPVTLVSDLYGGDVRFDGKVAAIGIGTGSAFSLLPAQNATGNWIKIVQRLPVRVDLEARELERHPLRIGLSMTAKVNLHDTDGPMLATAPPAQPVLVTDVYKQQLKDAQALIDQIVHANLGAGGR